MLSCKELVENSSDYLDKRLSLSKGLEVRLHLTLCVNCRRFIKQMQISQAVYRKMHQEQGDELDGLAQKLAQAHRSNQ
ncbi:zf-HC2 domain-containing protein [Pseudomonas sp. M30-35]|uniref:zf-HC2 domain-containing protein n=1 Tax=Pseudomonas sp. M30-35 TaxID=1981174 RepID=UPI000B3C4068|nr:zf-HC2 domain-containing protein [Pseudomonas sp. M30-35]ARU89277.1 anti-sigma factor [Pseudomonas sp. M30-35]